MKVVIVEGTFPELRPELQHQTGRGEGCNLDSATGEAIRNMYQKMKCRRNFKECTITLRVEQ